MMILKPAHQSDRRSHVTSLGGTQAGIGLRIIRNGNELLECLRQFSP